MSRKSGDLGHTISTMKSPWISKGWQVTISVLFSWLCHSVSGQIHYSIVEEMRKDSVIANIADDLGLDIKQLSSRKLRIVSDVSEKYFYVNLNNGNLYVKDRIDRETLCGTTASCFLSFEVVVENPLSIFAAKIEIQDINDNPPRFFHETFTLEVIESTSPGTRFVLQSAEDPDIGINSIQSYKVSDNQHFMLSEKINSDGSKSPEIELERTLDRESQNIYELLLTAMDGGNPVRSGSAMIKIIINDANDNFPKFTHEVYKVNVSENSPLNTTIILIKATDKDEGLNGQVTYSFSKTSGNVYHTGTFKINPETGEIKTSGELDFEQIKNYELSVQAKDGGGLVAHCKVVIEVVDENDNAPEISITSLFSPIPEDSPPGTAIALIRVRDQDSGANAEVVTVIVEDLPFHLILSSGSYYTIVTTKVLDREEVPAYNFTVLATDRGSPPLSSRKEITLKILDVNDNPPKFAKSNYVAYVPENNLPGASIYSIQASDPDVGDNAKIMYTIFSTNPEELPASSHFSINIETGVLYAQRSFDYEQHKEFQIQVSAKDNGSPSLNSNATLFIRIVDQNDNAPKILYPSPDDGGPAVFEMVPFDSEPGSLIAKVVAVDADSGHNGWLSYHFIASSDPIHFIIDHNTGEIRTSHVFQEKDISSHKVVVMVKDNGDPLLSSTVTFNLVVAKNFQQVLPKFGNKVSEEDPQSNLQLYLVITLALISLLFIITVMLVIISKCKKTKPLPVFDALTSTLYPPGDPRMWTQYPNGTLTLPYSYNVCVALDSSQNDFTYIKPNQEVPVDNLIDADDSGLGNESIKVNGPTTSESEVSLQSF